MGTEVDCKSSFEGYYSMRDVNEDSNSSSWPLFYGEKSLSNSHYYNGFIPRPISDDKDALKQKMLEHEAIFKNQVHELHRLYLRQRDMMEEVKRKDLNKHHNSIDASSSSSFLPSQKPYEDNHNHKWQMPTFPCSRPSIFGAEISNSPLSCSKGNNNNNNINNNDHSSKDCEIVECRPSKVRKKLFDLELPPDENMENEEYEGMQCKQVSEESSFRGSNGLADLNEPVHVDEPVVHGFGPSAKPHVGQFFDQRHEFSGRPGGVFNPILVEGKGNGRDWLSNTRETGNSRSNMNFTPGTYSEISRIQDHGRFNQTHHLPFPTSRASTSYPHANSSNFGSSWEKANGSSLTHKLTSFQKQQQQQQPSLLSSPQSHVVVGDRWQQTNGYNNNINNNNNNNIPNGFYRGSSSGSKEPCARFPSSVLDDNIRSQKIFRGSNFIDLMESTKGMDLNTVEETVSNRCNQSVFPWLQSKPAICKNDSLLVNNRKFPGFENSCVSEIVKIKKEIEPRGFDINVAWDDDDPENKQIDEEDCKMENEKIKNHFDLNSCVTEDEEITVPESLKCLKKTTMEIDLEAPAVPETEEDEEEEAVNEVKKLDEELAMVAAEAMVAIFSQTKSTSDVAVCSDDEDRLLWFAEVIGNTGGPGCNEVDEYEELTLKLEMTKEQDYMPKPLAPDYFQEPDEAGPSMGPLRPRRGQARRGRPRRDFQRDILPGLVSLSRHEVTEDLQIFGGLMRATGHSWNVGLTRRNGTRGRRKSVVVAVDPPPVSTPPLPPPPPPPLSEQLGNLEVVGLDERSLTGWGKTTRRPRRQRCGTGSSVAVPLT